MFDGPSKQAATNGTSASMSASTPPDMHSEILDSVSDGVFTVDLQWRITSFNRAAEQITGVSCQEAIGRPCCEVFRATICQSACALRETLSTGQPIVNRMVHILDAAGRRIPISISTGVLRNQASEIIGGVETFRDLSVEENLRKELRKQYSFGDIIGQSRPMQELFAVLPQVAESESIVLLEGASGTGKELFARAIHDLSPRGQGPFVAVNCAALPDTLLESELFGYKAGAFTDARRDKPGRFAAADGGTLFLDEIGDISPAMQVRLLRVLEQRTYEPLGSVEPVEANVRIIAATNKNLQRLVKQGRFRQDLYFRINVVRLRLPRLRDRREDVPLLVEHFVAKFRQLRGKNIQGVSDAVLARLMDYEFPGNVRELENVIEHAFVLCRSGLIQVEHLPPYLREQGVRGGLRTESLTLREMERMMIQQALRRCGGNRKAAAQRLGIHPSTLFRKAKALGVELPEEDGRHR